MKKIFSITLLYLIAISTGIINAQSLSDIYSTPKVQMTPSSPQSQIFEQYVNHEVTEYNGLPDIEIPLYEISIKGMTIPITLSYHASGIKYKQFDGDLGAGWSINAGGYRVSRNVYGRPDEMYPLYPKSIFLADYNGKNAHERDLLMASIGAPKNKVFYIARSIGMNLKDGEYDQFTYMLPSTSGRFVITDRVNKTVSLSNQNNDKITLDPNYTTLYLGNINIIDNKGFTYMHGPAGIESMFDEGMLINVSTAWPLNKIVSPYGEEVDFAYSMHAVFTKKFLNKKFILKDAMEYNVFDDRVHTSGNFTTLWSTSFENQNSVEPDNIQYIDRIETDKEKIEFVRKNIYACGTDFGVTHCSNHVISEIIITNKLTSQQKKIKFNYGISPAGANTNSNKFPWHRLLTSISIQDRNNSPLQMYNFDYYPSGTVNTHYPDQWGYYKPGAYIPTGFTTDLFLDSRFKDDSSIRSINYDYFRTPEYITTGNSAIGCWFDRSTGDLCPNYFALKKITYPTGGYTEYEYESNRYQENNSIITGGGLRVKKIISKAEDVSTPITSVFEYETGVLSGDFNTLHLCFADQVYQFNSLICDRQLQIRELGSRQGIRTYSTKPLLPDADLYFKISYPKVTVTRNDASGKNNGKIVSTYSIPKDYELGTDNHFPNVINNSTFGFSNYFNYGNWFTKKYSTGFSPVVTSRIMYNQLGSIVQQESYTYETVVKPKLEGVITKQKVIFEHYPDDSDGLYVDHYNHVNSIYNYAVNIIEQDYRRPLSKEVRITGTIGSTAVVTSETYAYDNYNRLTKTTTTNSHGTLVKELVYPEASTELIRKNIYSQVVKEKVLHNGKATGVRETIYPATNILPLFVKTSTSDESALRTDITYKAYDSKNNLIEYTDIDNITTVLIWGYNGKYPIAEIKNADYATIEKKVGSIVLATLLTSPAPGTQDWSALKNLQSDPILKNAMITIYKYIPLVGVSEITDPRGISTYYLYDNFGRLKESFFYEGTNKRIIEAYQYNYKNK